MACYAMGLKVSAEITPGTVYATHTSPDILTIKVLYNKEGEIDGAEPQDGDWDRDFAHALVINLPYKEIAAELEKHNIVAIERIGSFQHFKNIECKSEEPFGPTSELEITIEFWRQDNVFNATACQLLRSINGDDVKEAIYNNEK